MSVNDTPPLLSVADAFDGTSDINVPGRDSLPPADEERSDRSAAASDDTVISGVEAGPPHGSSTSPDIVLSAHQPSPLDGTFDALDTAPDTASSAAPTPLAALAPPAAPAFGTVPFVWANAPALSQAHGPNLILVDGDGNVVHAPGEAGGAGGNALSGGGATLGGGATNSPLHINISYDSSVANAPAAFKTTVAAVVQYFESQFTDAVTVNIHVGYGEVDGSSLGSNALGESLTYLSSFSYAQVKSALAADATSADDAATVASLPSSNPTGGTMWASTAEAKALGLLSSYSGVDGYVGFASGNLFDYDNSNGVAAGQYDFYGVVAHELTEVMGRALLVGQSIGPSAHGYYPLDLFHYSAAGVRDFTGSQAGYFSADNGATNLDNFNTNRGGDYGDWAASAGHDSFLAFSPSGVTDAVTAADLTVMDVIGWDRAAATAPPSPPASQADLTLSSVAFDSADTTLSFVLHNDGTAAAPASTTGIYLSLDSTITTGDMLIGTSPAPALAPGDSDSESVALTLPTGNAPHVYYLGALADYDGSAGGGSHVSSAAIAIVLGNNSSNMLAGTSAAQTMFGLGGNDTLSDGPGGDTMYGGAGNDTYIVRDASDTVAEDPGQGTDTVRAGVSYTLPDNIEKLVLTGSAVSATGNAANNTISGDGGDNTIDGGLGNDRLTGRGGADSFVFNTALDNAANVDTITDFRHAQGDTIVLDHTVFAALGAPQADGSLQPADFFAGPGASAQAATDFILYDTRTGALSYDADGSGAGAAIHFATLSNHPALTAHDILIV